MKANRRPEDHFDELGTVEHFTPRSDSAQLDERPPPAFSEHTRGLRQPCIGTDLYAGDGLLMFWSHKPVAYWQDLRWLAQMRQQLRPNAYCA